MTLLVPLESLETLTSDEVTQQFGGKAAGLLQVPYQWRPKTLLVSKILYEQWVAKREGFVKWAFEKLQADEAMAKRLLGNVVILRSSATDETIRERGQFLSRKVELEVNSLALATAMDEIFAQYAPNPGYMCLVIQPYVMAAEIGFLSNELRLVDKPYRWIVEAQVVNSRLGRPLTRSISAKQARHLPSTEPLVCVSNSELMSRLKSVALHFWNASTQRTLLEWCWDGTRLWIVQRDLSLPASGGRDPSRLQSGSFAIPTAGEGATFRKFAIGTTTPWGKLRNVSEFATDGKFPPHKLFFATAATLEEQIAIDAENLVFEINTLTGGRCVLRTDAVEQRFNRKRTNTVDGRTAVAWMRNEIAAWRKTDISLQDVIFILHAYIPAVAAAWSYYNRRGKYVRIDGLWGLADGLQYYPTDTYICDPRTGKEHSVTQRYKDLALFEQADGTWRTERIDPRFARFRALTKAACADIAAKTKKIADNNQKDVQIMWFVGIPRVLNLGENLPWFKASPDQPPEERRSKLLSAIVVKSVDDLRKLEGVEAGSCKVILEPVGEDLRSDAFIDAVSARCKALGLPVEVRGSILGHAYHQLLEAGVAVFTAEPSKKIVEVRQRKAFDKLVRDQIPDVIASKGEFAHADELEPNDLRSALIGKLLEEAGEFLSATEKLSVVEELSDLHEVVRGLASASGVAFSEVVRKAEEKAQKRGGFLKGVVLRSTELNRKRSEDPQLFSSGDNRNIVRLNSLRTLPGDGSRQEIMLSQLMLSKHSVSLRFDNKYIVNVSISIEAGNLIVEIRGIEGEEPQQLRLF